MISIESIYLAAIIQGIFQIVILLTHGKSSRAANRMLALLIGLLTLSLWNLYSYKINLPAYWRLIDYNGWYSPLFWGPSIYLYIMLITTEKQLNTKKVLSHFSVGLLFFTTATLLNLFDALGWSSAIYLETYRTIHLFTFYIQISLYLYAGYLLIQSHNDSIKNQFSTTDKINLTWLQRLIFIFALLIAIDMVITVPSVLRDIWPIPFLDYYLLAEAIAIYLVGYFYLQHTDSIPTNNRPKYQSSPLDDENSLLLLDSLEDIMQKTRPYQNQHLKLGDLADLVGIHPHYLSQLINERLGKNFYDFINGYRANMAKELIAQKPQETITDIAYEAGFNNRVSFNKTFKKYTGMTPSQYRRNHRSTDASIGETL